MRYPRHLIRTLSFSLPVFLALASCNLPGTALEDDVANLSEVTPEERVADSTQSPTALPATPTASPPTPDLTKAPLIWFAPLPPMTTNEGRPFIGSEDFMDLFRPEADWEQASDAIHVFKLYGEWVAYNATDAELHRAISDIQRRGMALAVEASPLTSTAACGQGIEGFAGIQEGRLIAERIQKAGGRLDILALDEPYFFAHVYRGPNACNWPAERIADGVDEYIQVMKGYFPEIIVGDTEPFPPPTSPEEYRDWLLTFRQRAGYDLAFLHMDLDWSQPDWPEQALQMEAYGREIGIPIGIIYFGNGADPDDATWIGVTGQRILQHEMTDGGEPEHVLFQSWVDHPDFVLPESDPTTFTGLIRTYASAPEDLGFRREGPGANVALEAEVRVSGIEAGHPGEEAVDGDVGTHWSAGAGPPQWIELDLGSDYSVAEIALTTSQYPAGETVHRVFVSGSSTAGKYELFHTFSGSTSDGDRLVYAPEEPWPGISRLRVVTDTTPSWVAWREIQVTTSD